MKSLRQALVASRALPTARNSACLTCKRGYADESGKPRVTIFGGNGFIGSHIVKKIAPNAAFVRVACRNPKDFNSRLEQAVNADPSSPLAKVKAEYADITISNSVKRSVQDADVVINCVNLHHEVRNSWDEILVDGVKHIAHEAHTNGVKQFVHFSCIGSEVDHKSNWSDYKFRSEDMALGAFPNATVLKPGLTFGPGDWLLNRVLSSKMPVITVPKTGALIQPVFVSDVAAAAEKIIFDANAATASAGKVIELVGNDKFTLAELLKKFIKANNGSKSVVEVPYFAADFIVGILQFLPDPLITRDHTPVLKMDLVAAANGFEQLGIQPTDIETALASYLGKGTHVRRNIDLTSQ